MESCSSYSWVNNYNLELAAIPNTSRNIRNIVHGLPNHRFFPQTLGWRRQSRVLHFEIPRCQKMFVPGFGDASPESKAARNLQDFFTYIAVKIVIAQLESYNPEAYEELMEFISRNSLNDGETFCRNLMRESPRHRSLALRILEVRSAYSKRDFEWDNLKKLAFKMVDELNTRIMRDYVLETSDLENGE